MTIGLARMFFAAPKDKIRVVFDTTSGVQVRYARKLPDTAEHRLDSYGRASQVRDGPSGQRGWHQRSPRRRLGFGHEADQGCHAGPPGRSQCGQWHSHDAVCEPEAVTVASPMLQNIDWTQTGVPHKYATDPPASEDGISALLGAGLDLETKLIKGATQAHLDAANAVDGILMTPLANHEAVTVVIAKLIASAPPAKIEAVFDAVLIVCFLEASPCVRSRATSSWSLLASSLATRLPRQT